MKTNKISKKELQDDEGLSDEEFIEYFEKYEKKIEEYNKKHNILPTPLTSLQKLEFEIAKLSVLYIDNNKDKKYGIETTKLLFKLKEINPDHCYLTFLNYILEENPINNQ